jgi:hypothetical protein
MPPLVLVRPAVGPDTARHDVGMTEPTCTAAQLRAELAKYHQELLAAGNHRPSTIATYIQHPERFIAYLESAYDPRRPQGRNAG